MRTEFDARWHSLAREVFSGMREWRVQHPRATLQEIEEELDKRLAQMRADDEGQPILANGAHDLGRRAARCDDRGDEDAWVDDDSAHLRGR